MTELLLEPCACVGLAACNEETLGEQAKQYGERPAMKKILLAMVACLGLAACNGNDDKVYTVDELVNDPATLTRIYKECGNDPGRLAETPNCKNAAQAQWKSRLKNMKDSLQ